MIHDGAVLGAPLVQFTDTKANVEAIAAPVAGMIAYAGDTGAMGHYDGVAAVWVWGNETPLVDLGSYAQGSLIYGAGASWAALAHPGALYHLQADATDVVWSQNITTATLSWVGLGAAKGRLVFEDAIADEARFEGCGYVGIENILYHIGDADTYLIFSPDFCGFRVGGLDFLYMTEAAAAQDEFEVNPGQSDIDFIVNTNGLANALFVQGSDGAVTLAGPSMAVPDGWWIGNSAATARLGFDSSGATDYVYVMGAKFGIGTITIPHGGVGAAIFAVEGADNSVPLGPHVQYTTAADDHPLFQQLNLKHDDIYLILDAYYDGAWKSGDAGSNCQISKNSDKLRFRYDSGVAQGGAVTWNEAFCLDLTNGRVGINEITPDRRQHTRETSASTNVVIPVARFESEVSGGVGAAGHGAAIEFYGESSTTTNQAMGIAAFRWSTATHASRRSRFELRAWYIGSEVLIGVVEAPTTASVDGNARGIGSVDWQGRRTAAGEVASGVNSVISGGSANTASGTYSTVAGGVSCIASGTTTFAVGYDAHATHNNSFVLSATNAQTVSWAANTFTTRCHGGAQFYSAGGVATGVVLAAGAGAWANLACHPSLKRNMVEVDYSDILNRLAQVPLYRYGLKSQPVNMEHISPVGADFNDAYGFTESESGMGINTLDGISVSLAGVKALHAGVLALRERVQILEAQLVD